MRLKKAYYKGFWEIISLLLWTKWYTDVLLRTSVTIALGWEMVTQNKFYTQEGDQREWKNMEQDPWLNFPCSPPLQSSVKWTCKSLWSLFIWIQFPIVKNWYHHILVVTPALSMADTVWCRIKQGTRESRVDENAGSAVRLPGFEFQLYHFLTWLLFK